MSLFPSQDLKDAIIDTCLKTRHKLESEDLDPGLLRAVFSPLFAVPMQQPGILVHRLCEIPVPPLARLKGLVVHGGVSAQKVLEFLEHLEELGLAAPFPALVIVDALTDRHPTIDKMAHC